MADEILSARVPIPERILRDVSKDVAGIVPHFSDEEPALGVKRLYALVGPILDTADVVDLGASHRAAACNLLCAIIEKCNASGSQHVRSAVLDDFIWPRLFNVYLHRSDGTKGKSMRQMLLVLTGVLVNDPSPRSLELQEQAVTTFLDIICRRQDRLKVKPALQGLSHFLQKNVVTIPQLLKIYSKLLGSYSIPAANAPDAQSLFSALLSWIIHHDTSLSAGHLVKNFLAQLRRASQNKSFTAHESISSVWMLPVINYLRQWSDRIQEFKTHVFPYCFLPNIGEYLDWLSFLHFRQHVTVTGLVPLQMQSPELYDNGLEDFEEFRILLASIETGKELGIVKDVDYRLCNSIEIHPDAIHLPDDVFGNWMSHTEPDVRLAGLFLCVYSTAVTRPLTGGVFRSLERNLAHLHTDTDANFRRELLGYIQKLINRLRGSTATLARGKSRSGPASTTRLPFPNECFQPRKRLEQRTVQDPLSEALSFIVWYIRFLESELRSDASYQRRITALRAITIVLKSGVDPRVSHHLLSKSAQGQLHWAHGLQISSPKLIRVLLDLILDPFDDIRDASVSVLRMCLESLPEGEKEAAIAKLPRFIVRAETAMLRTGRADHADGVARAYALYFSICSMDSGEVAGIGGTGRTRKIEVFERLGQQLKSTLQLARENLSEAVNGRPVHGTFAAIRYIIDQEQFYSELEILQAPDFSQWKLIHDQILSSVEVLWSCVQDTLCADAPEGYVPEELEEETSLNTKEILSYSWRGLKEASILLRSIVSRAPIGAQDHALIAPELFERLGRLCFTQLIELRHRGAFSTVAQTFAAFCRRCVSAEDQALRSLPERWYEETLLSIQAKANAITRRSGGIPALMASIIAAEPQPGGKLFPRAMRDLIGEASLEAQSSNIEESRLPQVHAFNCIKEIFTTSRLSAASEAYIGEGLELAAKTLNSKIWPIRNCSLMLFKALIERLLGSDEAQDWKERDRSRTSRFSYNNYPRLVGILQGLLDPEGPVKKSLEAPDSNAPMDLHGAEGVFPALQILRQAAPPEETRATMLSSTMRLLGSPHWHLRDMAARTVTTLLHPNELLGTIKDLLARVGDGANGQHGALLCAKYTLRKMLQTQGTFTLETVIEDLRQSTPHQYLSNTCPFTQAVFLDLISLCGMAIVRGPSSQPTMQAWASLTASIAIGPEHMLDLSSAGENSLLKRSLAQLFFIDRTILRPDCLDAMLSSRYQSIGDALLMLSHDDPDTCAAALDTLHDIIQTKAARGPVMQLSLIILQVYHLVRAASDEEALSKAQCVLADGLALDGMSASVLSLVAPDDLEAALDRLETQCLSSAPSTTQTALRLLGILLDWSWNTTTPSQHSLRPKAARYIRLLRTSIVDTNPFDARFAAAQSLASLQHLWALRPDTKADASLLLGLACVLYDMLVDDDDDIRDTAAQATAQLLAAQGASQHQPVVPGLAAHRLAMFLVRALPRSQALCREALRRLTGTPAHSALFGERFADAFAAARQEDVALFNVEKQNLFKDDSLDAVLWARMLASLPVADIPPALCDGLAAWVGEGLAVLAAAMRGEGDGALGWGSKAEVFALGVRVVCGTEVVLKWLGQDVEGMRIRRALGEFVEAGEGGEGHGLWLEKAERVLEASVIDVVRSVGAGLMVVHRGET